MADDVATVSPEKKRGPGAPKGSHNNYRHGIHALEWRRLHGEDRRLAPYRRIRKLREDIGADQVEARKKWHRENAARMQFYCTMLDDYLLSLKHPIRKGKVNPAVDLRLRFSEAVDRNLAALDAIGDPELDLATKYKLGLIK
jgi:hypothetical protein